MGHLVTDSVRLPINPYLAHDAGVASYNTALGVPTPLEFDGVRAEERSWKTTAYLHAGLNPADPFRLSGPDALRLLEESCVNDFSVFRVGGAKHAVMCAESGNVIADGVVMRIGEEEFDCFFLNPVLRYLVETGGYDVALEDLSHELFLFQLGGPRSLEVLERATATDLHSLRFLRHTPTSIDTSEGRVEVRAFRFGVAGTLAYEVHGPLASAPAVYDALVAAGQDLGLVRLGLRAYGMNHTQNGYVQAFIHFLPAWTDDPGLMAFLDGDAEQFLTQLPGSAGPDASKRFGTPFDFGWGELVTFNHDFTGRAALEQAAIEQAVRGRRPVTLAWNRDDVVAVVASQFDDHPADHLDLYAEPIWTASNSVVVSDDVLCGDDIVGISSGRIFSPSERRMLSLAILDSTHATLGTQLEVLWGAPGTPQQRIRATVALFPHLALTRNPDVSTAPILRPTPRRSSSA